MTTPSPIDWASWRAEIHATLLFIVRDGEILLIEKKRGLGAGKINGPGGKIDPGESALTCGKRELAEEVGLAAERWSELQTIYASPGYVDEAIVIYAATRLTEVDPDPDDEEQIELVRLPVAEIDSALPGIADAKTLVGLMLLKLDLGR